MAEPVNHPGRATFVLCAAILLGVLLSSTSSSISQASTAAEECLIIDEGPEYSSGSWLPTLGDSDIQRGRLRPGQSFAVSWNFTNCGSTPFEIIGWRWVNTSDPGIAAGGGGFRHTLHPRVTERGSIKVTAPQVPGNHSGIVAFYSPNGKVGPDATFRFVVVDPNPPPRPTPTATPKPELVMPPAIFSQAQKEVARKQRGEKFSSILHQLSNADFAVCYPGGSGGTIQASLDTGADTLAQYHYRVASSLVQGAGVGFVCVPNVIGAALGKISVLLDANIILLDTLILADPPDPNFTEIAQPSPPTIERVSPGGRLGAALAEAFNAYANNQALQIGLKQALLKSVERAQGAAQARNGEWVGRHNEAAREYDARLTTLLAEEPRLLGDVVSAARANEAKIVGLTAEEIHAIQRRVGTQGLPTNWTQAFRQAGADGAMLGQIQQAITSFDASSISTDTDRTDQSADPKQQEKQPGDVGGSREETQNDQTVSGSLDSGRCLPADTYPSLPDPNPRALRAAGAAADQAGDRGGGALAQGRAARAAYLSVDRSEPHANLSFVHSYVVATIRQRKGLFRAEDWDVAVTDGSVQRGIDALDQELGAVGCSGILATMITSPGSSDPIP